MTAQVQAISKKGIEGLYAVERGQRGNKMNNSVRSGRKWIGIQQWNDCVPHPPTDLSYGQIGTRRQEGEDVYMKFHGKKFESGLLG